MIHFLKKALYFSIMTYEETVDYLFKSAPLFQHIGGAAYKEGLDTTIKLNNHFHSPHQHYKTIHVAGTNGKGSTAHTIAAVLQHAGYKVGLFTSPHLIDFRERIRINGEMIDKNYVINFVKNERSFFEALSPSFFEITTALAFKYFADQKVDIAIIEVGLGGRLDCTNIINPILSIITNISLDHTQFLGHTHREIATEKAGIIKDSVPVVIGETIPETYSVFKEKANCTHSQIIFSEESNEIKSTHITSDGLRFYTTKNWGDLEAELTADYQVKNTNTILNVMNILKDDLKISIEDVKYAFRHVCEMTGLQGRWQEIRKSPKVICDAGHNPGGWKYLSNQLNKAVQKYEKVRIVFGIAADKDIDTILSYLPKEAKFYWSKASIKRALNENELKKKADSLGLSGNSYESISIAYNKAISDASPNDFIFVGGSCFVVADLLTYLNS